ncbi:hypothetical protein BDR04DRAFT_1090824 [Suillus decipiens]|nr:hypothetical protein BDR04DRAFT_1090824 [Suillus decipiens]
MYSTAPDVLRLPGPAESENLNIIERLLSIVNCIILAENKADWISLSGCFQS